MINGKCLRVLIVEDDSSLSLALRTIVAKNFHNADIRSAANGSLAFEMLLNSGCDIVISDWNLPGMSGMDLLRQTRKDPSLCNIPFLMVTARSDRESVLEAIHEGVTDYVTKPFRIGAIIQKIKTLVFGGD